MCVAGLGLNGHSVTRAHVRELNVESINRSRKLKTAQSSIANLRHVAAGRQAPDFLFVLAKELDRDLRRSLVDGLLHLLGGVGQLIRIDIDSYPTTRADHAPLRLQSRYGLFQFMSAARALKLDLTGVNVRHSRDSLRPDNWSALSAAVGPLTQT